MWGGVGGAGAPPTKKRKLSKKRKFSKDACTLLSLQAKKPKNLLLEHVWMVWRGWGDAGKSYESVSVKFKIFGREKGQENRQNHLSSF